MCNINKEFKVKELKAKDLEKNLNVRFLKVEVRIKKIIHRSNFTFSICFNPFVSKLPKVTCALVKVNYSFVNDHF